MARTVQPSIPRRQNLVVMYPWAHVSDSAQKRPFSSLLAGCPLVESVPAFYQFKWKTEIQKCNFLCSFGTWKGNLKETLSAKQSLRCGLSSLKWLSLLDLWPGLGGSQFHFHMLPRLQEPGLGCQCSDTENGLEAGIRRREASLQFHHESCFSNLLSSSDWVDQWFLAHWWPLSAYTHLCFLNQKMPWENRGKYIRWSLPLILPYPSRIVPLLVPACLDCSPGPANSISIGYERDKYNFYRTYYI